MGAANRNDRPYQFLAMAAVIAASIPAVGLYSFIDSSELKSKLSVVYILLASGSALAAFRCRRERMDYFLAGEMHEDSKIDLREVDLHTVRQASWSLRASRASTYSSISLGIIIVTAVILVANSSNIGATQQNLFIWVMLIASISVILYGVSLQLWDEALGSGYDRNVVLELRTSALVLSSLGWITLVTALGLTIVVVHTPLGAVVGGAGVIAGLYIFEHKWRLAHRNCAPGLEKGGFSAYLHRLFHAEPDMRKCKHSPPLRHLE